MLNSELIADGLRKLGVIRMDEAPDDTQAAQALTRLNQVMAMNAEETLNFPSWVGQTDLTATAPLPEWSRLYVSSALAIALAPDYGISISPELAALHDSARTMALRKKLNEQLQPVEINTLPIAEGELRSKYLTYRR